MLKKSYLLTLVIILAGIIFSSLFAEETETIERQFGNLTFKDGAIYRGQHLAGVADGEGVYVSSDGIVMKGTFKEGKLLGHGMFIEEVEMKKGVFPYKGYQITIGIFIENLKISRGAVVRSTPHLKNLAQGNDKGSIVMYQMKDNKEIFDLNTSKIFNW